MVSSRILRRVVFVRTDVSEERNASTIPIGGIGIQICTLKYLRAVQESFRATRVGTRLQMFRLLKIMSYTAFHAYTGILCQSGYAS
jgi:hypothetical protein